jgi:hypothetical protein
MVVQTGCLLEPESYEERIAAVVGDYASADRLVTGGWQHHLQRSQKSEHCYLSDMAKADDGITDLAGRFSTLSSSREEWR